MQLYKMVKRSVVSINVTQISIRGNTNNFAVSFKMINQGVFSL